MKVHHRVHMSSQIVPIVSHINPVQALYYIARRCILILPSHLCLGLPSSLFPSVFPTKTLYTNLLSPLLPRDRLSGNEIEHPCVLKRWTTRRGERSGPFIKLGVDTGSTLSDSSYNFCSIFGRTEENLKMFLIREITSLDLSPEKSHSYPEILWLSSCSSNQIQDSVSYLVITSSLCGLCYSLSLITLNFTFRPLNFRHHASCI